MSRRDSLAALFFCQDLTRKKLQWLPSVKKGKEKTWLECYTMSTGRDRLTEPLATEFGKEKAESLVGEKALSSPLS